MKTSVSYKIFTLINTLFFFGIIVVMLFPYLNIFAKAFNEGTDTMRGGLTIYPRVFTLENFKLLFSDQSLINAAYVTICRVVLGVSSSVILVFIVSYALNKDFVGKKYIMMFFTIPMFIGAGTMPTYVLMSKLGFLNNFWIYIIPGMFSFYYTIIVRSFINTTIPKSLEESAVIDGASEFTIFWKIILPLSKPILATISLWLMVFHWNDYSTTLIYIRTPKLFTLQYKMMELIKESERLQQLIEAARVEGQNVDDILKTQVPTSDGITAAQIVFTTVPIICVYPFLQKYFVKGFMVGSIKG